MESWAFLPGRLHNTVIQINPFKQRCCFFNSHVSIRRDCCPSWRFAFSALSKKIKGRLCVYRGIFWYHFNMGYGGGAYRTPPCLMRRENPPCFWGLRNFPHNDCLLTFFLSFWPKCCLFILRSVVIHLASTCMQLLIKKTILNNNNFNQISAKLFKEKYFVFLGFCVLICLFVSLPVCLFVNRSLPIAVLWTVCSCLNEHWKKAIFLKLCMNSWIQWSDQLRFFLD